MNRYKVDYVVRVFHQCSCVIDAESEKEAKELIEEDYGCYEDDSEFSEIEGEVEYVRLCIDDDESL